MKLILLFLPLFFFQNSFAETIEFHILKGTGAGPWNTLDTAIVAKVGDSIIFYNDDDVDHRLHTQGAPCSHGDAFKPGTTWTCVAQKPWVSEVDGPLYDHKYGESAEVWFEVSQ